MITLEAERTLVHVVVNVAYAIKRVNRLCAGEQATAEAAAAQARIVGKGARATSRRLSRTLSVRVAGGERGGGWGVPLWGASTSVVGAQLGRLEAADRSRSVRSGKGEGVRGTAFSFPGKALVHGRVTRRRQQVVQVRMAARCDVLEAAKPDGHDGARSPGRPLCSVRRARWRWRCDVDSVVVLR